MIYGRFNLKQVYALHGGRFFIFVVSLYCTTYKEIMYRVLLVIKPQIFVISKLLFTTKMSNINLNKNIDQIAKFKENLVLTYIYAILQVLHEELDLHRDTLYSYPVICPSTISMNQKKKNRNQPHIEIP